MLLGKTDLQPPVGETRRHTPGNMWRSDIW